LVHSADHHKHFTVLQIQSINCVNVASFITAQQTTGLLTHITISIIHLSYSAD